MCACAALAELYLLGQNKTLFISTTIDERSQYKDIQSVMPAKVAGGGGGGERPTGVKGGGI